MAASAGLAHPAVVANPFSRRILRARVAGIRVARPGLRAAVLVGSALVVVGLSVTISASASDQLRASATESALHNAQSIIRGYVDPILTEDDLDIDARRDPEVAEQLSRLVLSGDMRRINIWTRDGRVVYSTDEALRGVRLGIDHELAEAFAGSTSTEFGSRDETQVTAAALPERYLEIYAPIRGDSDGNPIGVFEVYVDAGPIEARVAETRDDVFLTAMAAGAILLGLLWAAFAGASRLLSTQNRSLVALNDRLHGMAGDLRQREARFRSLVQNSSDVVVVVRPDGVITYESDAVERVLGHDAAGCIGRRFDAEIHPNDAHLTDALLEGLLASPGSLQSAELRLRHADGTWRWVEMVGQSLMGEPAIGGLVLNYRDVTDRKRLEDQLQHEAFHDPLTGLANRALFADRVGHALARSRSPGEKASVLFADLDDFKVVNDSLGHAAGDELLTAVAERIRACLRRQDTAARLGGDEFGILLEETGDERAGEIAERILDALRQPFAIAGRQLFMQASIGIAVGAAGGLEVERETADELLRNADAAMYTAKARGKGRHAFYQAAMHASALRRLELRERLEAALGAEEFVLHYQPVVELASQRVVGFEALVRWRQHDGQLAGPAEFIPTAEETGLIVPLGRWVLEEACHEAAAWGVSRRRPLVSIAVNVASRQLRDPAFPTEVASVLADSGLAAAQLVVEVTESALLDEGQATTAVIADLKALGVRIALDDFGTGYSSLSHLRRFPIDILKIDKSFVDGIDGEDRDERALVRSIVRLAHSLKLETVAEGVERPEQLDVLRALGAGMGQGYHFARPMDATSVRRLLRANARMAS
ncbi:MAG: putative bifunctional diguanylate cyclase/phosphodiesterase [Candidatus Limnocylindria bacterium]